MKKVFTLLILIAIVGVGYYLFSKPENYEIRNENPTGKAIVCFGDSLTSGYGAPSNMSYPAQLSKMINQPIINMGVPGETTEGAHNRIDQVVKLNPKIVLITLGGNDLKNGIDIKVAFNNLSRIINAFQNNGALVVIGGIDVPFFGKGFGEGYKKLAKDTGSILIPNIYSGILMNPKLMSDRIHPNSAGYTKIAEKFYKVIRPYSSSY